MHNSPATWHDRDGDGAIDAGEAVHWMWNSSKHGNGVVPLYAKGAGAELLDRYAVNPDPVRGRYLNNTDVFKVMDTVLGPNEPRRCCGMP